MIEADPKHQDRFEENPGVLCKTADRGKSKDGIPRKSFRAVLEEVCTRNDINILNLLGIKIYSTRMEK